MKPKVIVLETLNDDNEWVLASIYTNTTPLIKVIQRYEQEMGYSDDADEDYAPPADEIYGVIYSNMVDARAYRVELQELPR